MNIPSDKFQLELNDRIVRYRSRLNQSEYSEFMNEVDRCISLYEADLMTEDDVIDSIDRYLLGKLSV